jgi:hypothetical protein
MDHKG